MKRHTQFIGIVFFLMAGIGLLFYQTNNNQYLEMDSNYLESYFSDTYQIARQRFLDVGIQKNASLDKLMLDNTGPDGEDLSIDIAWFGSKSPHNVLIHVSGVHGVEGFTGSAIQLKILEEIQVIDENKAIIFVHGLNPYGMAWLRRFNENNVDLNRNFLEPSATWAGISDTYKTIDAFLNPTEIHFIDTFYIGAIINIIKYGMDTLREAIAGGQYENPKGIFLGGKELEQGPKLFRSWLKNNLSDVNRLFIIDVHTGLGKWRQNSLFHKIHGTDTNKLPKEFVENIVPEYEEDYYEIRGPHAEVYRQLFPEKKIDFVTQEFGTYSIVRVTKSLRAENQLHNYGSRDVNHPIKIALKQHFYPQSDEWRRGVLQDGIKLFQSAYEFY